MGLSSLFLWNIPTLQMFFFLKLVAELPKYTKINNYTVDLVDCQQSLHGPIYSLGLVELETLKIYIKTNSNNGLIRPSQFSVDHRFFLFRSLMVVFIYMSITKILII